MCVDGTRDVLRAMLVTVAMGLAAAAPASAATFTVNTTSDASPVVGDCATPPAAGDCSLRQAIAAASAGDTVSLPASATPFAVTLGTIDVSKAITISGAGANTTTIDANGNSQIFEVSGLPSSSTLTISLVTIEVATRRVAASRRIRRRDRRRRCRCDRRPRRRRVV